VGGSYLVSLSVIFDTEIRVLIVVNWHLDHDDIALLVALVVSIISVLADEVIASPIFKLLKAVGLIASLWFAVQRIRQSRPFYRDFRFNEWGKDAKDFFVSLSRAEHGRGRYPQARCLVQNEHGEYAECWAKTIVAPNGDVTIRVNSPVELRLEVRK
jgi:hypothetical protein